MPTEYDKLVRDEIPAIIEDDGKVPVTHTVEGEERQRRLRNKLDEEVVEYQVSHDPEELVDVFEVIAALWGTHDRADSLLRAAYQKAMDRGQFAEGIVLERIDDNDGNNSTNDNND